MIVAVYRVTAGLTKDYPSGMLYKQIPLFKERGLNLERFHPTTLNVSIAPTTFKMMDPEYTSLKVSWTDVHPREDFSFWRYKVKFSGGRHAGYV